MTRADLLSLTADALAALANRGLVKRAAKELDAGAGPALEVDGGAVAGRFADGVVATLPPGVGLERAGCTCGATGVCRHRVAVVLAYQRRHGATAVFTPWSPGDVTDDRLRELLGERVLTAARRLRASGVPVRLRRPTAADPVATAELPSCTVRFLVPGELGYAHTDAAASARDQWTVLAVWAFREADERGLVDDVVRFDLGGRAPDGGLGPVPELASALLLDGAAASGPVFEAALERARADLVAARLHWPALAVAELVDQLRAYRERSAHHDPARVADLITELHARSRATGPRSQVLGVEEPAETPLRRIRLTSLGCRVRATSEDRTAELFFADGGAALVLRHRWPVAEGEHPTGHDLAGRRVRGTSLAALAASNVVSESATRSAGRLVRVSGRASSTSVTPLGAAWEALPDDLVIRDFATAEREWDDLPPRVVRPRVAAELVRVVEVAEVGRITYHPGAQRLDAVLVDGSGATASVRATHRAHCPAALDALARALPVATHVSGEVRRSRGGLVVDPIAVLTPDGVVVPDLATGTAALEPGDAPTPDPLTSVVDGALSLCAEAAHRGLRHLAPPLLDRARRAAHDLRRLGLVAAGDLVAAFADDPTPDTWRRAHLRLVVTAERR
ncbi:hypothetical protein [Saccharothrix xinjiangensis]|uniref:SWIM-type domain-containing protein n=1 Tax=Saccharothrix xinjiangensis TaxID=204798 RepID=A0ABV9YDY8_9PSEU